MPHPMSSFPIRTPAPGGLELAVIARHLGIGVEPEGGDLQVDGVAPLHLAGPRELGLLADRRYLEAVAESRAGGLLVSRELADLLDSLDAPDQANRKRPRLVVPDPHAAMRRILERLHPERPWSGEIHPRSEVHPSAELGAGVRIGPFAIIEEGAVLGDRVRIGAHSVVGAGVRIGDDAMLMPQVTLYPGTELGARVVVHAGARIGVDGFGFVFEGGEHLRIPHVGRCVIEEDVEIGPNSCIDRGSIGETRIAAGSKLDNLVHIGHNVRIGARCLVTAQVGFAGSATLGKGVMLGGQAGVSGHIEVGDGARIAAQAGVIGDVPPGETVMGFPARAQREFLRATAALYRGPELVRKLRAIEARVAELESDAPDDASG
jgi:UDP-3-O-[3-hydroxymyristoyl] glucosamine N-acyltransferase